MFALQNCILIIGLARYLTHNWSYKWNNQLLPLEQEAELRISHSMMEQRMLDTYEPAIA